MTENETLTPSVRIECRYLWLLAALIPFGILFFAGLGGILIYLGLFPKPPSGPLLARGFIFLLGFTSWFLAFSGVRLLPFCRAVIVADDAGLRVIRGTDERVYPWSEISAVTDHSILQILDVYGPKGRLILSVDYFINGFSRLQDFIFRKLKGQQARVRTGLRKVAWRPAENPPALREKDAAPKSALPLWASHLLAEVDGHLVLLLGLLLPCVLPLGLIATRAHQLERILVAVIFIVPQFRILTRSLDLRLFGRSLKRYLLVNELLVITAAGSSAGILLFLQ